MVESIGKRIARLRLDRNWTQQALAARLGISRVAISHIELDLSVPGERTITLLAGLFKCTPHELVHDTTYPPAKTERLPLHVAMYTQLDLDLALLENDLAWLACLDQDLAWPRLADGIRRKWSSRLDRWESELLDDHDRALIRTGLQALKNACWH